VLESARAALTLDPKASLDALARRLGVSRRTLQRALHAEGTTHAREVQSARVRIAQRLMLAGESKLSAVALEAGFATQAQMSTAFRKLLGEAPSAWGARQGLRPSRTR
jgi:AraC-like DNA-binding protein